MKFAEMSTAAKLGANPYLFRNYVSMCSTNQEVEEFLTEEFRIVEQDEVDRIVVDYDAFTPNESEVFEYYADESSHEIVDSGPVTPDELSEPDVSEPIKPRLFYLSFC